MPLDFSLLLFFQFKMHSNLESLYKDIPPHLLPDEYLPDDYDGPSAGTIKSIIGITFVTNRHHTQATSMSCLTLLMYHHHHEQQRHLMVVMGLKSSYKHTCTVYKCQYTSRG